MTVPLYCLRTISDEIVPFTDDVDGLCMDIVDFHLNRTRRHVELVNEYASKLYNAFGRMQWFKAFYVQVRSHDHDKLNNWEFIAHYAPYIVKKYCTEDLKHMFDLKNDYVKLWNERYVVEHVMKSAHHPEHWCEKYGYGKNNPPYDCTGMPRYALAEMVCDWCAVGKEKGNNAMNWFDSVNGIRFIFNEKQQSFIKQLISEATR